MQQITVKNLSKKLNSKKNIIVVDVRTHGENRSVYIEKTINIPVDEVPNRISELNSDEPVYIFCNSGNRSFKICKDMELKGSTNFVNVEGGIQDWITKGLPVIRSKKYFMPMMQQVMSIAGFFVLIGVLTSYFINNNFIWLSGAVGTGLLYAGLSGNCYMTKLLAIMPWNK